MSEFSLPAPRPTPKTASRQLGRASTAQKNAALYAIADGLEHQRAQILVANGLDVADAQTRQVCHRRWWTACAADRERGWPANGGDTRSVAALPDPGGRGIRRATATQRAAHRAPADAAGRAGRIT